MCETNVLFAFIIGGLTFLAVNNFFFRKDGPWAKRNRIMAVTRVRSNQMRRKMSMETHEEGSALKASPVMVMVLVIVLVTLTALAFV